MNILKIILILVFIFIFIVSFQGVIRFPKYTENKLFFGFLCGLILCKLIQNIKTYNEDKPNRY